MKNDDILIINNQEIKTNKKNANFDVNLSVGTVKYNIPLELEVIKGSEADLKFQDFLNNQYLYDVKIEINRKYNEQ